MSSRKERLELIRKIQELRGSKVLVYFTGDRRPFSSQIAEDAVLPLYKHLLVLMLCCIILRNIDNKNPKCVKERSSYFFCGLEKDDFKRLD